MKVENIKQKHLVLGKTFNDFSNATDDVDYTVEDLCCQVTDLNNIFYWLNTESVWGPIGFVWEKINNNGYFVVGNISYDITPKIPDSFRHKTLNRIYRNRTSSITLLDSNWSHIKEIVGLANSNIGWVILHINSFTDTKINVNSTAEPKYKYIFKGNINNISTQNMYMDISRNIILDYKNQNYLKLYFKEDCNDGETLDLRKYLKNITTYAIGKDYEFKAYFRINDLAKNIIIPCVYYYTNPSSPTKGLLVGNTFEYNYPIDLSWQNIYDANKTITFILPEHPSYSSILNFNEFPLLNVTYTNFDKYNSISYYYKYCRLDNIDKLTEDIINKSSIIFYKCILGEYKHGYLMANDKYFYDCKVLNYNNAKVLKNYGTNKDDLVIYDYTDYIKLLLINDSNDKNYPTLYAYPQEYKSLNNAYYTYTENYIYTQGSGAEYYLISKNEKLHYSGASISRLIIDDNNNNRIEIDNNCIFNIFTTDIYYLDTIEFNKNCIQINITEENIIDNKKTFNNIPIYRFIKDKTNEKINIIIRNYSVSVPYYNNDVDYFDVNDTFLLYNIDFHATNKNYDNLDMVNHVLNSIITKNDVNDSKNKTINLASKFYNNINEETKNRLLGDGYTIIEQF